MITPERFIALIIKQLQQELTAAEQEELAALFHASPEHKAYYEQYTRMQDLKEGMQLYYSSRENGKALLEKLLAAQQEKLAPVRRGHFLRRWGWVAAASVLLAVGVYSWFRNNNHRQQQGAGVVPPQLAMDVLPGRDGAILTLADGRQVVLDSMGNGVIAMQDGAKVVLTNGQLAYALTGDVPGEVPYNIMSTPRGRQFNVVLPDGTKVWLNAASSLKYPIVFKGTERLVEVTGEAYFEVAANEQLPFKVKVKEGATIEVLGTHFNINAYTGEAGSTTTLLEGSVRITAEDKAIKSVVLQQGEQAQVVSAATAIKINRHVEIEKVMAWKNGLFNFDGMSLTEAMKQLERWYDLEVVYEKGIPDIYFAGEMSRNISLSGLLHGLKDAGVHFRIEQGKRLIVTQ
jgi:ferric-dicitrate binding protein FerR (iron transport regulator)